MSYWNGTEWVSNSMDQNSSNPIPPPSTELPQIPENLKGTINVNNATAEQLTNFYSKVYAYCDSQMNACKSSGDTSSTSYEWSVYYADLSSRAAHHYNNLKNETEDERQRKLAEEERKRSREQARIQREREERERQERVVSEMCRKAAEACKESFEAEKAKEEAAKKEKLKRASLLEEALINKITEEANDIADIEKVMQRRK